VSKLTTHQIAATLRGMRNTAAHASGKKLERAERSIACYEAELAARIAAGEPDPGDAPHAYPPDLDPAAIRAAKQKEAPLTQGHAPAPIATPYPPDNAVRDAEALIAQWGTSATVRAVCVALNNHASYAASMPLEDAPRVIAMQRRYAQ
jgi:hypothetical protein